jgi:hypothetical protein
VVIGHAGDGGVGGADADGGDLGNGRDIRALAVDGVDHPLEAEHVQGADDGAAGDAVGGGELVL